MSLCPTCKKNKAITHPTYGVMDCQSCQDKANTTLKSPTRSVEFTTDDIKWQRKEYAKDIIQPFRNGQLSKEFVEIHGKEAIKEVLDVTDAEIDNAKYVWEDFGDTADSYYKKNI